MKKTNRLLPFLVVVSATVLAGAAHSPSLELTEAKVVLAETPEASSMLAATELTNYVAKMTGCVLPVVRGASDAKTQVKIGTLATLANVPAEAKKLLDGADSCEAAWSGVKNGTLWIVGKEEVADLYATCHFLESKLGVRWFQAAVPEDPGDYFPRSVKLPIEPFTEFRKPDFAIRRIDMCSGYWNVIPKAGKECATRNGYQTPTSQRFFERNPRYPEFYEFYMPRQSRRQFEVGGGHVMFTHPAPEKTFDTHPEYFALRNGKRVKGLQYCFSSEGLLKATADYAVKRMKENGGKGEYLFGQADVTYGWCECDACRALDTEGTNTSKSAPNISTRLYKMSEKVAEMIRAEIPDADLRLWAYNTYRELPVGVKPDPRLKVQFCAHGRCYGHALDDTKCARNVEMFGLMKKWLAVVPNLYTYEYFVCTPPLYVCHERLEARDLKRYKKLGMIGWKNEGAFTGTQFVDGAGPDAPEIFPSNWQWLWLTGHLLWNADQDADKLLDDAESKYYGKAYPAMKQYHALRRELWDASGMCMGYPMNDPRRPTLLDAPGARETLFAYLDEADKLAGENRVLKFRLSRDRKWFVKYWVEPNVKMKAEAASAIHVKKISGKIEIDGEGDEPEWKTAATADGFRKTVGNKAGEHPRLDERLKTGVRVLRDNDNFYFLFTALEPSPGKMKLPEGKDGDAWNGDGLEFMLYPPAVDCRYYQIAANVKGAVYDASHPGGVVADDFGVEVKGIVHSDRYVIEVRVPVDRMHSFAAGETWRIMFGRNRSITDEICPNHWDHNFTVGGCGYHDITSFTPVVIE